VSSHTSNLVLEDLVEESCLKLSLPHRRGGDITSLLSSSQNDEVLLCGDGSRVEGGVGLVGLEDVEGLGLNELGGLVLGGGDKVSPVGGHLNVGDQSHVGLVCLNVLDELSGLSVVLGDGTILVSGDNELAQVTPSGNGSLGLAGGDGEHRTVDLLGIDIDDNGENDNGSTVSHTLLSNCQQQSSVLVELDALDGGGELPGLKTSSGLYLPELDAVVGGSGSEESGGGVDVDGPERSLVAVVGSETLSVGCRLYQLLRAPDAESW
jgi:hypothetical protein